MDNRTCTGCGIEFTPTHGRQRCCSPQCRKPSHAKVTLACDCCGGPAVKYKQAKRYAATYCGTLCRDYAKYGPSSCCLPRDHWARWFGCTSEWIAPAIRNQGTCQWCGQDNPRGIQAAYCSIKCKDRAKSQRRRAAEFGAPGEYTYSQVIRQYIMQGRVCAYCSTPTIGTPDPDHVVALSRGGRNDMTNIVASCSPCNSDKRDLTLSEWETDRERRGLAPVNTDLTGGRFPRLILDADTQNICSIVA